MTSNAVFLASLPYTSFDNPASGTSASPFNRTSFSYFYLEDGEDRVVNTPGVSIRESTATLGSGFSDSVDGDDGVIDGRSTGISRSFFSNFRVDSFTFDFAASALNGRLPTHAGIVWTDIGRNFGGTPSSSDIIDNTFFEAFGPSGELLGRIGPFSLGDESISRTTQEDRFFGVIFSGGISSIRLSMPGKNNWEADHLQYGYALENSAPDLSGDNRLIGTGRNDRIRGLGGNDTICGLGRNDRILGGAGNDTLFGDAGNDVLIGDAGNDSLVGGNGSDTLNGGSGNDVLDGGAGNDVIITGAGRDRITLRRGQGFDRVVDFRNSQDKIDLIDVSFNQLTIQQRQGDVLVKLGQANVLLIENTALNAINRSDFV